MFVVFRNVKLDMLWKIINPDLTRLYELRRKGRSDIVRIKDVQTHLELARAERKTERNLIL